MPRDRLIASQLGEEEGVLEGRVTGAITVFNLLGQKPGLEPVDLQLFDLLASHAATALHCTRVPDEPSKDPSARG